MARKKAGKAKASAPDPFWACVKCLGKSGRARYSTGSATCSYSKCRALYREERKAAKAPAPAAALAEGLAQLGSQEAAYMQMLSTRVCRSIVEVYAVSFLSPDISALQMPQMLNGVPYGEHKYYYLVRGSFGDGLANEVMLPGTRWVQLYELMASCTRDDVKKLEQFDARLVSHMAGAREAVQQILDDEEEGEEEEGEEEEGEEEDSEEESELSDLDGGAPAPA